MKLKAYSTLILAVMCLMVTSCINDPIYVDNQTISNFKGIQFVVGGTMKKDEIPSRSVEASRPSGCASLSDGSGDVKLYMFDHRSENSSPLRCFAEGADSQESGSRGIPVEGPDAAAALKAIHRSFSASAYHCSSTGSNPVSPYYMDNVEVVEFSGTIWRPALDYPWPKGDSYIRFSAHAPYRAEGLNVSPAGQSGAPLYTYTVPDDPVKQTDLLIALSAAIPCRPPYKPVEMTFNHALTGIRFLAGNGLANIRITGITINNVYGSGVYDSGTGKWVPTGTTKSFSIAVDKTIPTNSSAPTPLADDSHTLMMIPQDVSNASIVVTYIDQADNQEHQLTGSIPATGSETKAVWKAGIKHDYVITSDKGEITLTAPEIIYFTYQGGTKPLDIVSMFTGLSGTSMPHEFTVEYSTDSVGWSIGGLDWFRIPELTGNRGQGRLDTSPFSYSATVAHKQPEPGGNEMLSTAPFVGTETTPYNLSHSTGSYNDNVMRPGVNTANCYVVHGPGWYCLPLVYGNMIKNGTVNANALPISNITTSPYLSTFTDVNGSKITSATPTISLGSSPQGLLQWQDAENLVTNVELMPGNKYLKFKVNQATIQQGNAVVSVKDANGVRWSWHIWVTHLRQETMGVTNISGTTNRLMTRPIGYCIGNRYEPRVGYVKLTAGSKSKVITIVQQAHEEGFNCTYFQWGRKEPIVGITSRLQGGKWISEDKAWWDNAGNKYTNGPTTATTSTSSRDLPQIVRNYTLNPSVFYINTDPLIKSVPNFYSNLWDRNIQKEESSASLTYTSGPKTIYDPCPVGFKIPPTGVFHVSNTMAIHITESTDFKGLPNTQDSFQGMYKLGFYDPDSHIMYLCTTSSRTKFFEINMRLKWRHGKGGSTLTDIRTFMQTTGSCRSNKSNYDFNYGRYKANDANSPMVGKVALNDYLQFNGVPVYGMVSND